jgi:NADH-quinone oxidoreductase subunit G
VKGITAPAAASITPAAQAVAESLLGGERKAIFLGAAAIAHPQYSQLHAYAQFIAEHTGAVLGFLPESGNTVGAHWVGAVSKDGVEGLLTKPLKAVVLLGAELHDFANPQALKMTLSQAGTVVALSAFDSPEMRALADVLLPIAPYTETSGSYVNAAGTLQSVQAAVKPLGEARPAWKVLRVLGNLLNVDACHFNSSEEVLSEAKSCGEISQMLNNATLAKPQAPTAIPSSIERIADVPIHATDAIVRRAPALQATADGVRAQKIGLASDIFATLGIQNGDAVKITQDSYVVTAQAIEDQSLAAGVVRVSAATAHSAQLGNMFGTLTVERV